MQRHKKLKARILSLALSVAMVGTMLPATVFAAEGDTSIGASSITECHPAHDKDCGYIEAVEGVECSHLNEEGTYSCAPIEEEGSEASPSQADKEYVCDHTDDCGYVDEAEGAPCTHSCEICEAVKDSGNAPESNKQEQAACGDRTASNALLDKLLGLLADQQTMIDEGGADILTTDEFKALAAEIDTLYAHVDGCETCAAQMDIGGAYNQRFYPVQAMFSDTSGDGYSYVDSTKTLTITTNAGTTNWRQDKNIPFENVGGIAFPLLHYKIESAIITSGVTEIGNSAFSECRELTSIVIPESVNSIKGYAFKNCRKLEQISIPSGLTSIEKQVFSDCVALESVVLPSGLTSINENAFSSCKALVEITIPESVSEMGASVFGECTKLTTVTMECVTPPTLGANAFRNLPTDYKIMVPGQSLAAYKGANGWKDYESHIFGTGPSIGVGTQTGTLSYGTAGTATYTVTASSFDGESPAFTPSVQWKSGTDWGTTAPTGITGTLSGSGDNRTFTVSTTATVNAGEYEFKIVSGDVESTGKVKIDKAEYPSKTQSFNVKSNTANAAATASLPEIAGATYGTVSVKTNTDSLISGTPTVSVRTLTMNVASKPEGTTAVLEIPVTNATNYKDFTMTVNITAKDKTAATITVPALDKTYNGAAVTAPTPTAVERGTSTPVTLTYTYKWQKSNEAGVYTDISGNTAPKDAGSYKLVIEGSSDTHAGTTEIAFTISKATVTITADNKSAYVGDAKPALTYTATGIASGDTLTTEPTLEYESEPDMSKAGSVKIKAKDAVAPNTDNYESAITYIDGTLTISTKSSGGGGGGGGGGSSSTPPSGGSAGGVSTPGKTVIDNPVGNQGSKNTLAEAVKNAIATGTTNPTVYTNFANYTALTKDGLKAINDATAAAAAGKNVQLSTKVQLDNKVGNAVVSRITIDPVKLATVMPDKLSLGVWFDQKQDKQVTAVTNLFEKAFDNKIVTVTFEQKSPLAVNMEFAAKPDLSALNTKNLYFYSYDPVKNIYNRIATPNYWVDKNGYSHFTAPFGGSVVISDKPLVKK